MNSCCCWDGAHGAFARARAAILVAGITVGRAAFAPTQSAISRGSDVITSMATAAGARRSVRGHNIQANLPNLPDTDLAKPLIPSSTPRIIPKPPPPFDPTDPEALLSITKAFIATDFGVQSSQLASHSADRLESSTAVESAAAMPFYASSLLSDESFVWVSGNNVYEGLGLLTKEEYLSAGKFFSLRSSFPDLEYRAHDFRVINDERGEYSTLKEAPKSNGSNEGTPFEQLDRGGEITVRFTTLVTGTFCGAPLRLRSLTLEPNGKVMKCPPTSISITYSTQGEECGKITKLVTDMVLDRQVGNTDGLSGVPAAAVIAGAPGNGVGSVPPLVALGRIFGRSASPLDYSSEGKLAPFPDSVMIQLAKGVLASGFGLDDPNLLAEEFSYVEPLIGPMNKGKFLKGFDIRGAMPDLDYNLQNFRVCHYGHRVWVDSRAKGTRTGSLKRRQLPSNAASYEAPPEAISFTFDASGFCTRITTAAVLDPLLGNTGGLGGAYGALYATGTPVSAFKSRSINGFLCREFKRLSSSVTGISVDSWRLSDGRVVNGLPLAPAAAPQNPLPTAGTPAEASPKLFFAAEAEAKKITKEQQPTISPNALLASKWGEVNAVKESEPPPITTKTTQKEEFSSSSSTSDSLGSASGILSSVRETVSVSESKAQQLRKAATAARAEAAEAKKKAAAKKANEMEAREKSPSSVTSAGPAARSPASKGKINAAFNSGNFSLFAPKANNSPPQGDLDGAAQPLQEEEIIKGSSKISLFNSLKPLQAKAYIPLPSKARPTAPSISKDTVVKYSPTTSSASSSGQKIMASKMGSPKTSSMKTKSQQQSKSPTLEVFGLGGILGKNKKT